MFKTLRAILTDADLRRRLAITFFILILFRLMAHVPVLQVNQEQLNQLLANNFLAGLVDLLAGGKVLSSFSVVAAGVFPYLTARFVVYTLVPLIPAWQDLAIGGNGGRERLETYSRLLTIPVALLFAWIISTFLAGQVGLFPGGVQLFTGSTFLPTLTIIVTITAGSMLSTWLADQITTDGLGNGDSMIIWSGACIMLANRVTQIVTQTADGGKALQQLGILVLVVVLVVIGSVYLQEGQRRVTVLYGRRLRASRLYGGGSTHIPLQVNPGGITPYLAATGLFVWVWLIGSALASNFGGGVSTVGKGIISWIDPRREVYWLALFVAVVLFTYFYNDVIMQARELGKALRDQGGMIPGVRPGRATDEYLTGVTRRITLPGALGMGCLTAILPYVIQSITHQEVATLIAPLILITGIATDTMRTVYATWQMRHYQGFIEDSEEGPAKHSQDVK